MKLPLPGSVYGTPSLPAWMLVRVVRFMHRQHKVSCKIRKADIKEIYSALCMIVGEAHRQDSATSSQDVLQSIEKVRLGLANVGEVLGASTGGFHRDADLHALFRMQDALRDQLSIQAQDRESYDALDERVKQALDAVERFREAAEPIRSAADRASKLLSSTKGQKGGSKPIAYDQFLTLMFAVAEHFAISTKITTNRSGGSDGNEKEGPFLTLVLIMEKFLPENLQTATGDAAAKRIERFAKRKRPREPKTRYVS